MHHDFAAATSNAQCLLYLFCLLPRTQKSLLLAQLSDIPVVGLVHSEDIFAVLGNDAEAIGCLCFVGS